jgi:plasmid stabilization system protein ParE
LIAYSPNAVEHIRALRRHYESLGRDAAIRALDRALADAETRIERTPGEGLSAPRPYRRLARPGWAWIKSGRYWIGYTIGDTPIIAAVFFETANIPGRM